MDRSSTGGERGVAISRVLIERSDRASNRGKGSTPIPGSLEFND